MSDENRDFGTGALARGRSADFDAAKLAAFLKQYSVDDVAKAFFVLNLWLPNISSLIKLQYLYATLESICAELQESDRLKSFPDYGRFYEELFPLLPLFVALEDFVPEADWGEIKYFFNERYYRVFYGGELLNSYDFCYAFEILYTPLDKAFQAILTGRSPLLDLRHCLEFQDHVLRSIQQDAIEQELNPGDISVPSEEFWLRATRFLGEFNADEVCGSRFVADYLLDLRERSSAPVEMPRFTADARDGRSCPYLFLKTGRGVYPSMPRRSFCVVNDTWGTLLRKHEEAVTAVLDDKDIQHHMMVGFSRFIAARWRHESLFMPAAALDEDSSPHETVLIAVRSRSRLFVFHIAPPAISAEALGRYLQNVIQSLTECKRLLLKPPTRLALLGKGYVEFGSDSEGETLSPTFVVGVPWCSTALMSFEIPRDLDAEVMGLDQLCGLIDELENDDELSDFFDYLEALREFHIPPTTTYLDMFGSFRSFHSVLVRGVRMPDIVTFDATWGSSIRFRTLKDFWGRFPEGMFGPHPRSWTIPDERRTKHGLLLSSRELFHIAYFQRVGNASIYINAPAHLMTLDQGMIADSLMHSLADAFELYCPVMERLQFARLNIGVHVMLFSGSLVKESPELKHLLHLIPESDTWKIDGTRLKPSSYAFRVVYNDDRVKSELEAAVDRRFQMQLLIEVVGRINKIFPGDLDAQVEQELAHENAKQPRFTLISFDKHVSFPEGVRPVVPGLKEYKLADRDIAHIANDLGIEPGTHESDSGKEALNRLIAGLIARIDEYVSQFGLEECLPFLLGRVDALIAQDDRNRRQAEISLQHEVDYERGAHSSESHGDFLRNYKNCRYLVEKFVQLQPKGTSRLDHQSLQRCLALIDRLLSMYAVSDFLQYSLYPARLTIDRDFVASTSPGTERDFEEMQLDYGKVQAQIRLGLIGQKDDIPDAPMSAEHYIGELDEAWTQDFGFAFTSMVTMLKVMALWATHTGSPEKASYSASADEIASACTASIDDFESSSTPRILDFLTLKADDILKIATKNGDEVATTLPVWEHSKRLSRYAIKPLVRIRGTYYWGPHSADRSCRVWAGVPAAFRLPADFPAPNVKTILERGHDDSARCLQDKIAQIARRHTSAVRTEVFPHKFGGSVGDIGDCDVLAFLQSANILLNIESKVIDPAYCVKDAGRIQRKIFGRITSSGQPEVGYLQRVEARHAYLQATALELIAGLGWPLPSESPRVVSVFVTPTSYWWTMFPPIASDVKFLEIKLLDDFIRALSS